MRNDQLLADLIQDAVSEYTSETGEDEFSAVVTVATYNGWTQIPTIQEYDEHPRHKDPNGDNIPYWINAASAAITAALQAISRIPANIDAERANGINKTLIALSKAEKIYRYQVAKDN